MDAFIVSHNSALQAIRYARSRYAELPWDGLSRTQQQRALDACAPAGADIDYDELERVGIWDPEVQDPIDVLVGSAAARRKHLDLQPHVISHTLPSKSLLQVGHNLYCCAPALAVVQYAEAHPWQEVLALCMEICGMFALTEEGYLPCEAAMTSAQLTRYLAFAKDIRGLKTARQAAKYALDSAASPMEAIVAALYHSPARVGGFGLAEMALNQRVEFTHDAVLASGMTHAVLDAYIPAARTTIEYNGHHHDTPQARRHDERRSAGLQAMGIQTIPLNDEQLRNPDALEAIAKIIYRRMGVRNRNRTSGYRVKQENLLNSLRVSMGLKPC